MGAVRSDKASRGFVSDYMALPRGERRREILGSVGWPPRTVKEIYRTELADGDSANAYIALFTHWEKAKYIAGERIARYKPREVFVRIITPLSKTDETDAYEALVIAYMDSMLRKGRADDAIVVGVLACIDMAHAGKPEFGLLVSLIWQRCCDCALRLLDNEGRYHIDGAIEEAIDLALQAMVFSLHNGATGEFEANMDVVLGAARSQGPALTPLLKRSLLRIHVYLGEVIEDAAEGSISEWGLAPEILGVAKKISQAIEQIEQIRISLNGDDYFREVARHETWSFFPWVDESRFDELHRHFNRIRFGVSFDEDDGLVLPTAVDDLAEIIKELLECEHADGVGEVKWACVTYMALSTLNRSGASHEKLFRDLPRIEGMVFHYASLEGLESADLDYLCEALEMGYFFRRETGAFSECVNCVLGYLTCSTRLLRANIVRARSMGVANAVEAALENDRVLFFAFLNFLISDLYRHVSEREKVRDSVADAWLCLERFPGVAAEVYLALSKRKNLSYIAEMVTSGGLRIDEAMCFVDADYSLGDIVKSLPGKSAYIETFFIPAHYRREEYSKPPDAADASDWFCVAFTVHPSGRILVNCLASAAYLKRYLGLLSTGYEINVNEESNTGILDARERVRELIERALSLVDERSTIFFGGEGPFNNVGLLSLPYGEGYVIDCFAVRNVACTFDLINPTNRTDSNRALVVSAPAFGKGAGSWRKLRGSAAEGLIVKEALRKADVDVTLLRGVDASRSEILDNLHGLKNAFVHLSSHGDSVDGVPRVILAGANSDEGAFIEPADLANGLMSGVNLAVFALCYAGEMSDGLVESISGFVKASMLSGAMSAVFPTCTVDDVASAVLLQFFYEEYTAANVPVELALRDAIMKMRQLEGSLLLEILTPMGLGKKLPPDMYNAGARPFDSPKYWHAWVCYSRETPTASIEDASQFRISGGRSDQCEDLESPMISDEKLVPGADKRLFKQARYAFTKQDYGKTLSCIKKIESHRSLFPAAAGMYALAYIRQSGGEVDYDVSCRYAKIAAYDESRAWVLGFHYLAGWGCEIDLEKGADLIERSSAKGVHIPPMLPASLFASAAKKFIFGDCVEQSYERGMMLSELALARDKRNTNARVAYVTAAFMDRSYMDDKENSKRAWTYLEELCSEGVPEALAVAYVRTKDYPPPPKALFAAAPRYRYATAVKRLRRLEGETRKDLSLRERQLLIKHPMVPEVLITVFTAICLLLGASLVVTVLGELL